MEIYFFDALMIYKFSKGKKTTLFHFERGLLLLNGKSATI